MFLEQTEGISLNVFYQTIWSFINILQITIITIIFSFMLAFPETANLPTIEYFRLISIFLFFFDLILNFITKRQEMGKTKNSLKEIGVYYLQNEFLADMILIIMLLLSFTYEEETINVFNFIIGVIKLNNNMIRLEKYEYLYISNSERELYFGLLKVFLLNFAIAHVLSIILNLMGSTQDESWYDNHSIRNSPWIDKYIWGYYWGTTIMLTVGFGDISASNEREALILIFIETLSCITLAYNINCVGSIISQMRADSQEKKKKLKYFHKMCEENNVSKDLEAKICNFIEESYQIKEAFEFDEYEQVLETLPKNMHSEYIKESNKHLFDVSFFNTLNKKTLLCLAETVIRRITHPDELIKRKGDIADFMILQRGTIGLVCRRNKSLLNGTIMEIYNVGKNEKPLILSLDFIKRKILSYDMKSLYYSVIYFLDCEKFMESLKSCEMDFHLFCVMRDKDDYLVDENELYKCTLCHNEFHNRFECPKYHFKPLKQHVVSTFFQKIKFAKQRRNVTYFKREYRNKRVLQLHLTCKNAHVRFLEEYCSAYEIEEIENFQKYYIQMSKMMMIQKTKENESKDEFEKQMNKIEELLVKHSNNTEGFWGLECDMAYNYRYYFTHFNASHLIGVRLSSVGRKNEKEAGFLNKIMMTYL